jgi:hypothetical protein
VTPYVVTASAWTNSPLLTLVVSGPDAHVAARLSSSAMQEVSSNLPTAASKGRSAMVARQLGPPHTTSFTNSGSAVVVAVAVGLVVFGGWCCAVVLFAGLRRFWDDAGRPHPSASL